jgi:hypothetical protein
MKEHPQRKDAIKILQSIVVPNLRKRGFKGSFPNFRRPAPHHLDLLTFQFDRYGGGFVVVLASGPLEGLTTYWGEFIPPEKLTPSYLGRSFRLGGNAQKSDHWFRYDEATASLTDIADDIICLLDAQAEQWWASQGG